MAYKKKDVEKNQNELSDKVIEVKALDKVVEAKAEENMGEKVEIVKNGVTRIRMRSEVQGYIAQGWKLK